MNLKLSWSGWREEWFYLTTDDSFDNLCVPEASARLAESWACSPTLTAKLLSLADRVRALVKAGLSGSDVVRDFIKRLLCPLWRRARLAYLYTGSDDDTRESSVGNIIVVPLPREA